MKKLIIPTDDDGIEWDDQDLYGYVESIPWQFINNMEDDYIEVTTVSDVYKTIVNEETGEEEYQLVKSNVKAKQTLYKSEIASVKQVFNDRGNVKTNEVELDIKYKDSIRVIGKYLDFRDQIFKPKIYKNIGYELRK